MPGDPANVSIDVVDRFKGFIQQLDVDYCPMTFLKDNDTNWKIVRIRNSLYPWKETRSASGGIASYQMCYGSFALRSGEDRMCCLNLNIRVVMTGIDLASVGACNNGEGHYHAINLSYMDDPLPFCCGIRYEENSTDFVNVSARRLGSFHASTARGKSKFDPRLNRTQILSFHLGDAPTVIAFLSKTGNSSEPVQVVVGKLVVPMSWQLVALMVVAAAAVLVAKLVSSFTLPRHVQHPWYVVVVAVGVKKRDVIVGGGDDDGKARTGSLRSILGGGAAKVGYSKVSVEKRSSRADDYDVFLGAQRLVTVGCDEGGSRLTPAGRGDGDSQLTAAASVLIAAKIKDDDE
ncbi:hypothetical protein DFJ73DRAFT_787637 [Zopfochytrium polystomum]|nr:hypothetical protein DFJ73DRAFT_787637 [Zopfochytrium polystomum]